MATREEMGGLEELMAVPEQVLSFAAGVLMLGAVEHMAGEEEDRVRSALVGELLMVQTGHFVLFGREIHVHSHQRTLVICDGTVYTGRKWADG